MREKNVDRESEWVSECVCVGWWVLHTLPIYSWSTNSHIIPELNSRYITHFTNKRGHLQRIHAKCMITRCASSGFANVRMCLAITSFPFGLGVVLFYLYLYQCISRCAFGPVAIEQFFRRPLSISLYFASLVSSLFPFDICPVLRAYTLSMSSAHCTQLVWEIKIGTERIDAYDTIPNWITHEMWHMTGIFGWKLIFNNSKTTNWDTRLLKTTRESKKNHFHTIKRPLCEELVSHVPKWIIEKALILFLSVFC